MTGTIQLKWDPKNLEVRTRSVEEQLQPLVIQVTTLVNSEKTPRKGRGKSKKAAVLVAAVERAIQNFIEKGEQIANENPDIGKEMMAVVEEIRTTGKAMGTASREFAENPCVSQKRTEMVKAARALLAAVTRLLILADMVDVRLLLKSVQSVEAHLEKLRTATPDTLLENLKHYNQFTRELLNQAAKRQQELKDPQIRDDLAAARAVLKKSSTMLMSASKAYVAHPNIPAAKANKDQILKQICEAVETINNVVQGRAPKSSSGRFEGIGKLANHLDNLEHSDALNYKEVRTKQLLEQQLEELINGAMLISDSSGLRDERRNKIIDGCTTLREALQGLLSESMKSMDVDRALDDVSTKTKDLRRQLHKAIADKVSDSFLETNAPLLALVAAAQKGDLQEVETCAANFNAHCAKLVEVANQVCDLSNNEDGVKMVRYAASQLSALAPGVVNAARLLAAQPSSAAARENMDTYKKSWENQVRLLLDAVDDISTIDDILSVLDNHMYDDMNQYIQALQEKNPALISAIANNIRGRSNRIVDVVGAEMDNYEPCFYTKRVLEALKVLNKEIMPNFDQKTEQIVNVMSKNPQQDIDENEFIDATRLVYDGVREVRRAVLMNRADEDLDPEEVEFEEYATDTLIRSVTQSSEANPVENTDDMSGITVARQAMSNLPEKEKSRILAQVENFQTEKLTFDREVAKWDDAGNDIVVLAKYMCMIMMYMTDFVRQRGPLKTTTDVINAAKKISETGTKLDKLTRQIAEQCPESSTKKDLLAYLERVALYCHQINIIAKVKTDVQNSNEELILAGVESATSLIENAKNLMNAVVLTVKASYVASTKYSRQGTISSPIVVWKMKAPEKKPLVRLEKPKEVRAVVRKASQKKAQNPISVLAEFQSI